MQLRESWQLFALGSALFAALTALFGKLGVVGINSNLATFIRTIVILIVTAGILSLRQEWVKPTGLPLHSCPASPPAFPGCAITARCSWVR
jgi:bacterial/archaeal transporter family protein